MKRRFVMILAIHLLLGLSFGTVEAATIISLVPQSPTVTLGELISIDVVLTSTDRISSGSLDFTYQPGLVNFSTFNLNPAAVDEFFSAIPNSSTSGQLDNFNFASLSGSGTFGGTLATMTFDTVNTGTAVFGLSIEKIFNNGIAWYWGFFATDDQRNFTAISDADLASFTLNGASVQINPVPIPAAAWLLGSGLVGLVVLKRRKKA